MKVFLSWSGIRSHQLASALRDWLPGVLQKLEPWLSSEDMPLGERWEANIARVLEDVDVGILCLTPENLNSPWLLFEAGALSKRLEASRLCPYILDVALSEVSGPLAQFQISKATSEDTWRLIRMLNGLGTGPHLAEPVLERVFAANWPWLEERIRGLSLQTPVSSIHLPTSEDKLDEILSILRQGPPNASITAAAAPSPSVMPLTTPATRPRVFIGSSKEGLAIAEAIQLGLDESTECTIWNQSAFAPSGTIIESLVDIAREFQCAVLILTPDDMVTKRGVTEAAPRDNIIFEAGLFTGTLGRARTFLVLSRDHEIVLPSDLAGVTSATYATRSDGNLHAALGVVCTRIKKALGVP